MCQNARDKKVIYQSIVDLFKPVSDNPQSLTEVCAEINAKIKEHGFQLDQGKVSISGTEVRFQVIDEHGKKHKVTRSWGKRK